MEAFQWEAFIKKHGFKLILGVAVLIVGLIILITQFRSIKSPIDFPLKEPAIDFTLTNVDGTEKTLYETEGQVRLVYFYFSNCPDVCLPTTYLLAGVQNLLIESGEFGEKASIYSITFDPERDTQERLKEFSSFYQADLSAWYFLRGDVEYSRQLANDYGVYVQENDDGSFTHTNVIFLIDKNNDIRKFFIVDYELTPEDIVKDMRVLM